MRIINAITGEKAVSFSALKRAATNWAIILAGLLLYNGLNAVALIIVARQVSPDAYGQYLAAYALTSFLVVLPGFGMDAWLLTQPGTTPKEDVALWLSSVRARAMLLLVWLAGMGLLGVLLPTQTFPPTILFPTIVGVAFDSLTLLAYASLRTQNRHRSVTILQGASALALFLLTLLLPVTEDYIVHFAVGRALLSFGIAAIVLYHLGKGYWRRSLALTPAPRILASSRSFMVAELASSVYVRADLSLLSLLRGAGAAGVYGPAVNLLQASFLAPRALFFFMVPVLSRAYKRDRAGFLKKGMVQLLVQVAVGAVTSLVTFAFAPQIVTLVFGEAYAASGGILRLLSPIPLLRALNFALGALLTSSNRQPARTKVQLFAAIFNVVANLVVIVPFGVAGVAVVYGLSELLLFLGYAHLTLELIRQRRKRAAEQR